MSKEYIHYGHKEFNPELFNPVKTSLLRNKPSGGLWASPKDAEHGWKQWNEVEEFAECNEENSFSFVLSESANVCHLYSVADLEQLPKQKMPEGYIDFGTGAVYPDFEAALAMGYDAIELHLSEEDRTNLGFMEGLYDSLYGWDCDSIVILNPDIVIPLEREIKEAGDTDDILDNLGTEDQEEDWEL